MDKYFLYIDILGFSELVQNNSPEIDELYVIIASLNVHRHEVFKTIIFSDTILIYNNKEPKTQNDNYYIVMYLCEFVQDLQHRLAGRSIVFRAIITKGQFIHYEINSIPCFYGSALVDTYNSEKKIQAMGLFIDDNCIKDCNIFNFCDYNEKYKFVFITKMMDKLEFEYGGYFPLKQFEVEQTELDYFLIPEILMIEKIYRNSIKQLDEKVKLKYLNTFEIYKKRYPNTIQGLLQNDFSPNFISPKLNWDIKVNRFPEDFTYIKRMKK